MQTVADAEEEGDVATTTQHARKPGDPCVLEDHKEYGAIRAHIIPRARAKGLEHNIHRKRCMGCEIAYHTVFGTFIPTEALEHLVKLFWREGNEPIWNYLLNEVGVGTVLLELSRHVKKRANKPLPEIGKSPIMPGSKCIRESHKRERGSDYKNLSGCKVCDDAYVELFNDFTPEEAVKHLVDRLWNGGISNGGLGFVFDYLIDRVCNGSSEKAERLLIKRRDR